MKCDFDDSNINIHSQAVKSSPSISILIDTEYDAEYKYEASSFPLSPVTVHIRYLTPYIFNKYLDSAYSTINNVIQ